MKFFYSVFIKFIPQVLSFLFVSLSAFAQPDPEIIYDVNKGTITVKVLRYSGNRGQGSANFYVADLQVSTDGSNYQTFCSFNVDKAGASENTWTVYYPTVKNNFDVDVSQRFFDDNYKAEATITLNLTTPIQAAKKIRILGKWRYQFKYATPVDVAVDKSETVSVIKMSPLNDPTYEFHMENNVGYAKIRYSKFTLNEVDELSRIWLIKNGNRIAEFSNGTSDVNNVALATTETVYYVEQWAYGPAKDRIKNSSKGVLVPAFTFPNSASANYDTSTHEAIFNWSVTPVNSGSFDKSKFKLQIADNPSFTDAKSVLIDYIPTQADYSYKVIKDFTPNMYFRVSRDKTGFDWELSKSANVAITFHSIPQTPVPSKSELLRDNTAMITWTAHGGAWLPGSTFIITRTNHTTNTTPTEIRLTGEDFNKGKYIDNLLSICNEYTYKLQVVPPVNSAFSAKPAIQIPDRILPVDIGVVSTLTASKGYFPDRTEVNWRSIGKFDNFIVERSVYGSNNYLRVGSVTGSFNGNFQFDDPKGTPGTYYTYRVFGAVLCNNELIYSKDTLYGIGFRSPTGNINGRISYENGQPVEGASVRLEAQDAAQLGQSIYLDGSANSYLHIDSLYVPFADSAFTIETWIKPTDSLPKNQVIFHRKGQYKLAFNAAGALEFTSNGISVTGNYTNSNNTFIHLAGIQSKDSLKIIVNDVIIASIANLATSAANIQQGAFIGGDSTGNNFKGHIDEMRAWNIALNLEIIKRDFTRVLTGEEKGLTAYWRFDETIKDQFYDLTHQNDRYNRNDGIINGSVVRSNVLPTADQLSLKGYADTLGDYSITGIPYVGNGTTYKVVPLLGTHQFEPGSASRFISSSSNQFTIDFKDKSSFPVSGYVYYYNSTIPVTDVYFTIDGRTAQESNGNVIKTDASGKFNISVPVGTHEVKAIKTNHVFINGGKITDRFGNNLNYQGPVSERVLIDSTTIRFIGRVSGGAIQEALPLGHSLSVNNLGKNITIKLGLPSLNKYELNTVEKTVLFPHLLPANKTIVSKTRVIYQKNQITIIPDSLTGEFMVDLIPEKLLANTVEVTGWGDLLDGKPVSLDLTNKFSIDSAINKYKDSTLNSVATWVHRSYSDTVTYNASYKFIKRKNPSVSVAQVDANRNPLPYFGDLEFISTNGLGLKETILVVDTTKSGRAMYTFGNPVFSGLAKYHFSIKAFEEYTFYESDGVPKQQNGKDMVDIVPTRDGFASMYNNLKRGVGVDTSSLDSSGIGVYEFNVGDPTFSGGGLKDFSTILKFGQGNPVSWLWLGTTPKMTAYITGGKQKGTDFVTAGPDQILHVLRDPGGSTSYSFIESGSSEATTKTYTGSLDLVGNNEKTVNAGIKLEVSTGVGVEKVTTTEVKSETTFAFKHEQHYTGANTTEEINTYTTRFQTSDKPTFVGAPADVFVGYSTNITYGSTDNLTIIKRSERAASDSLINDPDPLGNYVIVRREGIAINEAFKTLFAYPQIHIENVLIPNLIKIRNSMLLPPSTANAQAMADNLKTMVYVSKLPAEHINFGKSNTDTKAFGPTVKDSLFYRGDSYQVFFPKTSAYKSDTILILNQYINNWYQQLAANEKAKLNSELYNNYSFHAGAPIEHSHQSEKNSTKTHSFNFVVGFTLFGEFGGNVDGVGTLFNITEDISTTHGGEFSTTKGESMTYGFALSSDGSDDYFSVDVRRSTLNADDKSFIFKTKGGASACPYEGETVTKYESVGTILDQPTQRIEVPKISVVEPLANNVPSSRPATFQLQLKNESETKSDAVFVINYVDNDSIRGATISVDGNSIGGGGRSIIVKYGETLTKELTITKGPNAMSYENIMILLHSACQYDPTGNQETIADTVLVSAHFIPSCSDITIKSPKNNWTLNTEAAKDATGKRFLPVTIDQFDINNSLFDHIELQYRAGGTSTWVSSMKFFSDTAKMAAAQGEKELITNAAAINYRFQLDDGSFSDQNYDIQAVSYCKTGPASFVTTESNMVSGIKDTYLPRLFGSPQPANGVLGITDDVRLNFNETIAAGLLTYTDFQVTGTRNGVKGDHSVSVKLDGQTNFVATEFEKNLAAKNITAEMWILPAKQADQTIFSHGSINESMELALTSDNHLQVTIGAKVIRSDKAVDYKAGEWAHVALVYNAATKTVTASYNFVEYISNAPVQNYAGIGHFEYGRSISKQGNFFTGKMHEARVWSDTLTAVQIQVNSLTQFSGAENRMLAYYPMNEGKGTAVLDKAHGSNAELIGQWTTPAGKAVTLKGNSFVKINTASAPVTSDMDYTLELWFKADANQSNATIASNGKGDGTDGEGSFNLFSVGFENSKLTYWNNGVKVQADENYLDNKWHHFAFAVNRNSGNAQLLVDGVLRKYVDAKNISGIVAPSTYLGVRAYHDQDSITVTKYEKYFSGHIDEFRIWKTYLNQTIISNNNNIQLKGDEIGLLSYYPFEKYFVFQNNAQLGYTLSDMKIQEVRTLVIPDAIVSNAIESDETAPIKSRGPVDNLKFDFVVNNDALIINLLEPKQAIDKTIVTFKVKNVRDLNGNPILSPITWTAYIDRNQLKWSDDELNLTKDVYVPMQFESYLVNSGGNEQKYRLDNLPTWLSANPATGTIAPKGRQKVTFTVNEGLNVGQYDEIVYMRNDNNESEALAINLSVKGKQPDWKVNPADFRYNMSVYGKIRINNNFSTNKDDLLAAFINGRCVGVTKNTYNRQNDLWYAYMTVYSDTVQFDNLEFRIYQSATGKTYQGVPTPARTIAFSNNAIVGTAQTPVIFDGKEIVFQDIALNQNWNWISLNVVNAGADSINTLLQNGRWNPGDEIKNEEKGFEQYTSIGWRGQLDTVRNIKAFFNTSLFMLKTANAQTLSVTGTVVNVKSIPILLRGNRWSYISYLPQVNMTVKDALAGYAASNEDVIKSQAGFAMYDSRNGWVGNLTYLEPGKGYMFYRKAASDVSFYYPSLNGSLTNQPSGRGVEIPVLPVPGRLLNPLQSPTEGNYMFAQNMTVTAIVESDFVVKPGDKVLAYVNGELRSKSISIHNAVINAPTFFFNIAGAQEQPVYFEIERDGEIIGESAAMFNFKTNNTVGTVGQPLVIRLKKAIVGVSIYPNPFFNEVNINVKLPAASAQKPHEVQVSVFDLNGKLIVSRAKEVITSGNYRANWNGKGANGFECAKGTYLLKVAVDGRGNTYKVIKN